MQPVQPTNVYTIGDSTLENIWWFLNGDGTNMQHAKSVSAEGKLQTELGNQYKVVSLAYDGFTTSHVLGGCTVGQVFSGWGPKFAAYRAEKDPENEGRVNPLDKLKDEISKNRDKPHYVVISVGGNDFRENLIGLNPIKLLTDVPKIQERYLRIVDEVLQAGPNVRPVLMFQYRTDAASPDPYYIYTILGAVGGLVATIHLTCLAVMAGGTAALAARKINNKVGGALILTAAAVLYAITRVAPLKITLGVLKFQKPGITMLGALMEKFYQPMLQRAKKDKLPILDLPNSFNPLARIYTAVIEPNGEGCGMIGSGLANIIRNHDYDQLGKIYDCEGNSVDIEPEKWHVAYPLNPI